MLIRSGSAVRRGAHGSSCLLEEPHSCLLFLPLHASTPLPLCLFLPPLMPPRPSFSASSYLHSCLLFRPLLRSPPTQRSLWTPYPGWRWRQAATCPGQRCAPQSQKRIQRPEGGRPLSPRRGLTAQSLPQPSCAWGSIQTRKLLPPQLRSPAKKRGPLPGAHSTRTKAPWTRPRGPGRQGRPQGRPQEGRQRRGQGGGNGRRRRRGGTP